MIIDGENNPLVGRRVRLTRDMTNPDSKWLPKEEGMPAGLEGTIKYANLSGPIEYRQLGVHWDNGLSLSLLPCVDGYELLPEAKAAVNAN